jgi:hypothetical protein
MPYKDPNSPAAKASDKRKHKKYLDTHGGYAAVTKDYLSRHPDALRNAYYKHEHGISVVDFEAQIVKQNNLCPIGNHPFGPRGRRGDSPCQDHDHESGQNRLILCRNHNVALGLFNDSVEDMQQGILYLQSFEKHIGELPCRTHLPSDAKLLEFSN